MPSTVRSIALAPVIVDERRGQLAVGRQPPVQHVGSVVVAEPLAPRLHVRDAAFNALEQGGFVDAQFDHRVKRKASLCQHAVKGHGLRHGARETVEDEALARIRRFDALGDDLDHDLIGHQARRAR